MIEMSNVSFSYPNRQDAILENVNLTIGKGEFVAIVGNNGTGKSTLCKLLNGLIPFFIDGDIEGSIKVDGVETRETSVMDLAYRVGYVYQDFENQILRPKVLDDASFGSLNGGCLDYEEKGREALKRTGLFGKEDEFIWQLSGGQKHLLALSGVLAMEPDILILDEPVAQLDPFHAKKIYRILEYLNKEFNKTIIVIEHDAELIGQYCESIVFMNQKTVKWKLPVKEAFKRVKDLETGSVYPPPSTRAAYQLHEKGYTNNAEYPTNFKEAVNYFSSLSLSTFSEEKRQKKSTEEIVCKEAVVQFENVTFNYEQFKGESVSIFENLTFSIYPGDRIALIGNNGSGKSTLLRLMMGLIRPDKGRILVKGEDISKKKPEQISNDISFIYQNSETMFIEDSIKKDISFSMKARNLSHAEKRTAELLRQFHLSELAELDGRLLSGGQMRRASLAIGVALFPSILLLDEPTASLDMATRKDVSSTLVNLKETLDATIMATHDMQLAAEWSNRMIVLHKGKIIADDKGNELFNRSEILEKAGIRVPELIALSKELKMKESLVVEDFVNEWVNARKEKAIEKRNVLI